MTDLAACVERALTDEPATDLDPKDGQVQEIQRLGATGADAGVVRFVDGTRAFAKRYLGPDAEQRLHGEATGLRALAISLPARGDTSGFELFAPRVLRADASTGLLLCEWIETTNARRDEAGLAEALVAMQRRSVDCAPGPAGFEVVTYLGDTPQDNRAATDAAGDDWASFFVERRLQTMLRLLESAAPPQLTDALARLCDQAEGTLSAATERNVLVHGDLWSGNLLWTADGAAIIDPAASWGHREAELGMLTLFGGLGSGFYARYRDLWPLEPGWERRVSIYRLYHLLNHRVLFGAGYDGSAMRLLDELVT